MLVPKKEGGNNPLVSSALRRLREQESAGTFGSTDPVNDQALAANAISRLRNAEFDGHFDPADEVEAPQLPEMTPEQRDHIQFGLNQLLLEERADAGEVASSLHVDTRRSLGKSLLNQIYGDISGFSSEMLQQVERTGVRDVDNEIDRLQYRARVKEIGLPERTRSAAASLAQGGG